MKFPSSLICLTKLLEKMPSLPPTATASVIEWCPTMSVLAVGTERGPVLLLRGSTGQQIWSVPGRKNIPVREIKFSSDGQFLAVRYEGGTFLVLQASNGRTVSAGAGPVSCLQWPLPLSPSLADTLRGSIEDEPPGPRNLILGTPSGTLRLVVLGNVPLREITVGQDPISHIAFENSLYGVICGNKFFCYRCNEISTPLQTRAIQTAAAVRAMDCVKTALKRYADECRALETNNAHFFDGLPDKNYLLTYFVANAHAQDVERWMIHQHEGGFRRWYKATSANLEEMVKQLGNNAVPNAKKLVDLSSTMFCAHRSMAIDFELIDVARSLNLQVNMLWEYVVSLQQKTASLAGVLEYSFGQAIDRVLSITPKEEYLLESVGDYFEPELEPIVNLTQPEILVKATWDNVLQDLQASVEKIYELPIEGPVVALEIYGEYAFVLCEGALFILTSKSTLKIPISGGRALYRKLVVVVDGNEVKFVDYPDVMETIKLDFEPETVAVKSHAVCAIQKDMRGFSLSEFEVNGRTLP